MQWNSKAATPRGNCFRSGGMTCGGFSLIEVLISTAILLVVVMMVSLVFQQQSGAIQAGQDRMKGQAALRNVVGMVVRDLSLAVDSANYTNFPSSNSFSGNSISFLATTGDVGADGGSGGAETALQKIEYNASGKIVKRRVANVVLGEDGRWSEKGAESANINGIDTPLEVSFDFQGGSTTFPESVKITATYQGKGRSSLVSGQSAGEDKEYDTDDDIFVGLGAGE